jgi:hypothetical protein
LNEVADVDTNDSNDVVLMQFGEELLCSLAE